MKKERNIIGNLCFYSGLLLLLAALGLVLYNRWDDRRAGDASNKVLQELEEQILINQNGGNPGETMPIGTLPEGDPTNAATGAVASGTSTENPDDSVGGNAAGSTGNFGGGYGSGGAGSAYVDGDYYIGVLRVPSLGLSLPVLSEWSYDNLRIAPCRYAGSCETNDLVIAGHNYTSHFSPLKWVDIGSKVYFTTMGGDTYEYVVVDRETVQPEDVEYMVREYGGDWDLTLFTCNTGGQTRCAVRCERN